MSKTEQKLTDAKKKQMALFEKKDKLQKELSVVNSNISSLEKQLVREKINDGIVKIQASGFSIDDIINLMEKEKQEGEK